MAMTATSILICVVVLNLHHRDPNAPVPLWLRRLTHNVMAPLVCMRSHTMQRGQAVYQLCEFSQNYAMSMQHTENHTTEETPLAAPTLEDANLCEQVCYLTKSSGKKKALLEEVVKHLRQITAKLKEKDETEALKAEWKTVAKILDRFFLMLFILIVIISSTLLLLVYPYFGQKDLFANMENRWKWLWVWLCRSTCTWWAESLKTVLSNAWWATEVQTWDSIALKGQPALVCSCSDCFYCSFCSFFSKKQQSLYSLSGKTSYRQISWSLEATRLSVIMIVSHWNLTGISAALLPRCLSNFRAIEKV